MPCMPQPAHQAFNNTMNYVCLTEQTRRDFETFNACMSQVARMMAGRRCSATFDNVTWDDGGKIVCRRLNQALDCGYPLIAEAPCNRDSPILIYNVYSLLAMWYGTGCVLKVPLNVQMPDQTKNVTLAQPIVLINNMPMMTTLSRSLESATKGPLGVLCACQ
uniref:AMP-dependent synthetase/ligase domain-containing protein n=1 Tax=Romanomermis culicivorax TaxID=13658 RepID=A0A915JY65_ROMCU